MRIVVLDGYALNPGDLSWEGLRELGEVVVYDRTPADLIVERSQGASALLTNKTPLRADALAQLSELAYIGVLATGYDIVDIAAAANRGVTVSNVPSYGTESVAQFVFALLLELCHQVGAHSESAREGDWADSPDFCYWRSPLTELAGKTLGIVGMGRIGESVARIAAAFGMRVVASGRPGSAAASPGAAAPHVPRVPLDTLLRESDVVSLHCPLTPQTERLINRDTLALMKPGALLVNTARGKLIAEADLAAVLNEGRLAGAAVDVLSSEPPAADNPLLSARNCIVTPHIAWASSEARRRLLDVAVSNLRSFIGGSPANVVSG
ncbi:D-2-hydroxyacid dehydrogenase [Cohnella thailandensis]|uniref:D-2-hydroxyacid dehydrogenase n=1 Tax=Cohnella thailandensis TaxID=557557 RepID=A0A841SVX7_9BACL|nr:D-2-hydroxyacid dehydrogenase [Cohnella thailandensis]MBB6634766.1 D-2-hydroxyacid dehydrogenase [Cohnella thailandensis]MBP1977882.1 glycerate dehydrogenase [Cohnella thailandensis]